MKPRILIMDDDPSICRIYLLMLNRLGYDGEAVSSGEETLEHIAAAQQAGKPFQAVILDLTVKQGMGGLATMKELRQRVPDIYAIVASGASRETILSQYVGQGFNAVLPKPFRMQDVADCLGKIGMPPQP